MNAFTTDAAAAALSRSGAAPRLADMALLLVAVLWGTSYGVAKEALAFYPVLGFLAVRFGLTFALLLPALLRTTAAERRAAFTAGLPLGLMLWGIFACETYGVAHTQASNAALLVSLCVVFTPLAEWALLGRRPAPAVWVCAGVSLLGAALLGGGMQGRWGLGDTLVLAAAVLRALQVCCTSRFAQRRPAPALALTAVQAGLIAVGCATLAWALPGTLPPLPTQGAFWWATLYLVLGCTVFAFVVQNWALRHSPPTRVGLLMGSEPVFGALFAVLWLGESLSPQGWAGAALIVAAAFWTLRQRPQAAPRS